MSKWDASLYDQKHSFVWELVSSLVDMLAPVAGEKILDVGCGTGQLTAQLHDAGASVIGMDYSAEMIAEARKAFPHIQFDHRDACDFDYNEPFDAVFSNAVFHWIKQPEKAVRCIADSLKPGGRFIIEFGGKGNVRIVSKAAKAAAQQVVGKSIDHPWYFPSVAEFSSILEAAGFEVAQAMLFDRPTHLDGDDGLRNWLRMFGSCWMDEIPVDQHDEFFELLEENARDDLYSEDHWCCDYRRIRIQAILTDA